MASEVAMPSQLTAAAQQEDAHFTQERDQSTIDHTGDILPSQTNGAPAEHTDSSSRQEDDSDADQAPTPPSDAQSVADVDHQPQNENSINQVPGNSTTNPQTVQVENIPEPTPTSGGADAPEPTSNLPTPPSTETPLITDPPSTDSAQASQGGEGNSENTSEIPSNTTEEERDSPPEPGQESGTPKAEEDEAKEKAFWVDLKEDTSSPNEEELKEIEESGHEHSARDYTYFEDQCFSDEDDPEYRPTKKIRLTWILKGVRGTKERPNYARVINSPAAKVGDYYWSLKLFPRGNNSRSLSCYIKCSKSPVDEEQTLQSQFRWFEGPGDAPLGDQVPQGELNFSAAEPAAPERKADSVKDMPPEEARDKTNEDHKPDIQANAEAASNTVQQEPGNESWRVPAQIGVVIYNPDEPRTNHYNSSCHQFNGGNDDWGWTNFQPEGWDEIHTRHRLQRQALLRNDTLAFDAYIRVFEDPTQRLWFHTSESESFWDGLSVTGYRAFGTPPLRHSPGVAGLASLLHLAPFRKIVQAASVGEWRHNSRIRPCPISTATQTVLYLMRNQRKNLAYVDVYRILDLMMDLGEKFQDVLTFWERFRRSIELEIRDTNLIGQIAQIFDIQPRDGSVSITTDPLARQQATLQISCGDVSSVSAGIGKLDPEAFKDKLLPEFLTVDFNRQHFDTSTRAWKLRYNKVKLDDDIDLRKLVPHQSNAQYTLYGFIAHCGERTSGHFYSVIRPDGPGSRWLAFEDGDGNKILIQTKKMLEEFEGMEGSELDENVLTRQTAYLAMYIRTELLKEYLPGEMESWDMPLWLKSNPYIQPNLNDKDIEDLMEPEKQEAEIKLEIFQAKDVRGRLGMLDVHALKDVQGDEEPIRMTLPQETTFFDLRHKLAESQKIDNVQKLRFWHLIYHPPLDGLNNTVFRIANYNEPISKRSLRSRCDLWLVILDDSDIDSFGMPEPRPKQKPVSNEQSHEATNSAENEEHAAEESRDAEVSNSTANPDPHPREASSEGSTAVTPTENHATETTQERSPRVLSLSETNAEVEEQNESTASIEPSSNDSLENQPAATQDPQTETTAEPENANTNNSGEMTEEQLNEAAIANMLEEEVAALDAATSDGQTNVDSTNTDAPLAMSTAVNDTNSDAIPSSNQAEGDTTEEGAITPPVEQEQGNETRRPNTPPFEVNETPDAQSDTSSEPDTEPALCKHTYKFLQVFDAQQQDVKTIGGLFAKKDSSIKDVVRNVLDWPSDKNFQMWWLEAPYRTRNIAPDAVFDNCEAHLDSLVILVGEVLSDSEKTALAACGKFSAPRSTLYNRWLAQRKHPSAAYTGEITINTFGRYFFCGHMLNGRFHGQGTHISNAGHQYTGSFVQEDRSGAGRLIYPNGDVYEGDFRKNERDGQGTFVEKRTGNKYVGGFKEDKRSGKGVTYWEVAQEDEQLCQICYGEAQDALFYDCGHVCACLECARQVESCPICRRAVKGVVRIYWS
ncbi:MAG: hypothetical protein Q9160_004084 [Pyrenula sp. 1 TL-2023]